MADTVTTSSTDDLTVFIKQKAGVEDLLFGLGATSQVREGENVTINFINAYSIPYDSTRSVGQVLDELLASVGLGN